MIGFVAMFATACHDLEVENVNNADLDRVLADPNQYPDVIAGAYIAWWQMQTRAEPNLVLGTVSDEITCSWNNFGMNVYAAEPRVAYDNSPTSNFASVGESAWGNGYGAIGSLNDVMRKIINEEQVVEDDEGNDITQMVLAHGYFLQGSAFGHLALLYDRVYTPDESVLTEELVNQDYPANSNYAEVIELAIDKLDKAIALCKANSFVTPSNFIAGTAYDQDQLAMLASTYAARLLAYGARTGAENSATAWDRVETYASNGINFDFVPIGDANYWYDEYKAYGSFPGWGRLDQSVVHLLDPTMPERYPVDGTTDLGPATSADARLGTDFTYVEGQNFRPERGLYQYSNYRVSRYDDTHNFAGNMYLILRAENDLLLAEAYVRQGKQLADAAMLINTTRVGRGGLAALTGAETTTDLLDALWYERKVELILTCAIVPFADRRRHDRLTTGSWNQLPIPGSDLELLGEDIYTFPSN